MNYAKRIASQLHLDASQVKAAIDLLDSDNSIPFIARYRKEVIGSLEEDQLRQIDGALTRLRKLDERRRSILKSVADQGRLTSALEKRLQKASTMTELEDLYGPYRQKRRTRATSAREQGLEPLALVILAQEPGQESAVELAAPFLNETITTAEEALAGARDIVAEIISDNADVRQRVRKKALKWSILRSQRINDSNDARGVYKLYYDYETRVDRLRPHQVLAINRGEKEKILRVSIEIAEQDWMIPVRLLFRPNRRSPLAKTLQMAIEDSARRLLLPAIERDVRRALSHAAEEHAIQVFAANLRGLLTQPPLADHVVMGIDPAYRTGCKVAVIDGTGRVLETTAIYPHPPQKKRDDALKTMARLIDRHGVTLLAIGNGTASRETEQLVATLTRSLDKVRYLIINEAGASVYSASPAAKAELPDLDVTLRGAVSIARRVQDPLAELVKIDPRSIGVGLYQHDINQKELGAALSAVVESVVNQVGVDANTASPALLTHVAGIGPKLAEGIVAHRDANGRFSQRQELLQVRGLGAAAFQQAAGFLRIRDGGNPLDASAIHPESYPVAEAILARAGVDMSSPADRRESALAAIEPTPALAQSLNTGLPTLTDILAQLVRPGRDPRQDLPAPVLRRDVLSMADIQPGMILEGTVRNVVDFGAFIDIGIKQDGLLHRSRIKRSRPLQVGDVIQVAVLRVESDRNRISLGLPDAGSTPDASN